MKFIVAIATFGGYDLIARNITAELELITNIVWLQYHTKYYTYQARGSHVEGLIAPQCCWLPLATWLVPMTVTIELSPLQ